MNQAIYIRRRGKILIPDLQGESPLPLLASFSKNLQGLGYAFSPELLERLKAYPQDEIEALYTEVVEAIKKMLGAHVPHRPFYPGFPRQVMEASQVELYINALLHYVSLRRDHVAIPREHTELHEFSSVNILGLGSEAEFWGIFENLAATNSSLAEIDLADLTWFVEHYGEQVLAHLPTELGNKEVAAHLAAQLYRHVPQATDWISSMLRTATDVLRFAVALSGGDLSLAEATKFKSIRRPTRRFILGRLAEVSSLLEDLKRWPERWKRLAAKLHPGEYAQRYPQVAAAFRRLREDDMPLFFNGKVESALAHGKPLAALDLLCARPGELARRLDHLLRLAEDPDKVLYSFMSVADKVSTPVLLQVIGHFQARPAHDDYRVFFPKGQVSLAYVRKNELAFLREDICESVVTVCEDVLRARFAEMPNLGRVWVDPDLDRYNVPFGQRSAAKALKTLPRGSRIPLPDTDTLRFFIWWKNGKYRTDIDLSATSLKADLSFHSVISYYNLKDLGGHHSGDIVDAPNGASEFIDISLRRCEDAGIRYVVMLVNSFTQQPFCDLPECFAGFMARQKPDSGEVYEPKTVQNKFDLSANSKVSIPLIIDVVARRVVWTDLSLNSWPAVTDNAHTLMSGVQRMAYGILHHQSPKLGHLFRLHAEARGQLVRDAVYADIRFGESGEVKPTDIDVILAEYL